MKSRKTKPDNLMRVLITTHVESIKDLFPLLRKADQLDSIHKELEERWETQRKINWSKGYDRWYEIDRKEKEMIKAKMADRWPRWFWKYWGFVSEEGWDSYMKWKEDE